MSGEPESTDLYGPSPTGDLSEAPRHDWLPLWRAPFYFLPEYTGRGQDWVRAITAIAERKLRTAEIEWKQLPDEEEKFLVRSGRVEFEVNPVDGKLSLHGAHGEFLPVFSDGLLDDGLDSPPGDFCSAYRKLEISQEFLPTCEVFLGVASLLEAYFRSLDEAIEQGEAQVTARRGSPLAPFSRIYADQWRYFTLSQDEEALALGPNGERLYSVFIAPNPKKPVGSAIQSKARSLSQCERLLKGIMSASPEIPTATKEDLRTDARRQWPDLSERSFDIAWRNAKRAANAMGWSTPGPRRRSPQ